MPLVKKLRYTYGDNEDLQTRELRTLAITQAAEAGQPELVRSSYGIWHSLIHNLTSGLSMSFVNVSERFFRRAIFRQSQMSFGP